nr:heptaprenyl diphosphate synthase component 1 [uncultured Bacillus sp.]
MYEYEKKLAEMKERIERHVLHPYLRQYISSPVIDEDKILILISILDQLELSPSEKDTFVIAIMLMQIALDTHDLVSIELKDESSMKVRQLTVLAGDYYSGLYYKYLAEISDIQIIKMLSEGVKNINEHKVFVYHKDPVNIEDLINSMKTIEFSLFGKLIEYGGIKKWNDLISNLLLVKRLASERNQFEETGHSFVFDALEKIIFAKKTQDKSNEQKKHLLTICDRYIEYTANLVEQEIHQFPQINDCLRKRMDQIIAVQHSITKTLAEEG